MLFFYWLLASQSMEYVEDSNRQIIAHIEWQER